MDAIFQLDSRERPFRGQINTGNGPCRLRRIAQPVLRF